MFFLSTPTLPVSVLTTRRFFPLVVGQQRPAAKYYGVLTLVGGRRARGRRRDGMGLVHSRFGAAAPNPDAPVCGVASRGRPVLCCPSTPPPTHSCYGTVLHTGTSMRALRGVLGSISAPSQPAYTMARRTVPCATLSYPILSCPVPVYPVLSCRPHLGPPYPPLCATLSYTCLLYTSPSPRDQRGSRMPSSA